MPAKNLTNEYFVINLVYNLFISILNGLLSKDETKRSLVSDTDAILLTVNPLKTKINLNYI